MAKNPFLHQKKFKTMKNAIFGQKKRHDFWTEIILFFTFQVIVNGSAGGSSPKPSIAPKPSAASSPAVPPKPARLDNAARRIVHLPPSGPKMINSRSPSANGRIQIPNHTVS